MKKLTQSNFEWNARKADLVPKLSRTAFIGFGLVPTVLGLVGGALAVGVTLGVGIGIPAGLFFLGHQVKKLVEQIGNEILPRVDYLIGQWKLIKPKIFSILNKTDLILDQIKKLADAIGDIIDKSVVKSSLSDIKTALQNLNSFNTEESFRDNISFIEQNLLLLQKSINTISDLGFKSDGSNDDNVYKGLAAFHNTSLAFGSWASFYTLVQNAKGNFEYDVNNHQFYKEYKESLFEFFGLSKVELRKSSLKFIAKESSYLMPDNVYWAKVVDEIPLSEDGDYAYYDYEIGFINLTKRIKFDYRNEYDLEYYFENIFWRDENAANTWGEGENGFEPLWGLEIIKKEVGFDIALKILSFNYEAKKIQWYSLDLKAIQLQIDSFAEKYSELFINNSFDALRDAFVEFRLKNTPDFLRDLNLQGQQEMLDSIRREYMGEENYVELVRLAISVQWCH